MDPTKQIRCRTCKQLITGNILYEDPRNSVRESVGLNKETFLLYRDHGVIGDKEVPSLKLTSFTIYDRYNHLCPFDKGLVDQGVNLYFSGYIKPIDNEDPSTNDGVLVSKAGPIREWWVYGFDGGATSVVGLTTDLAFYYLMKPSQCYENIFKNVPQRCRLSKLVVEFLLDFGFQSPKFEDLIQHIKSFGEFCEVEELLLREAQFLCNQILSFDEEFPEEEIPMVSYPCIQTLIKLTGITLSKQRKRKQ